MGCVVSLFASCGFRSVLGVDIQDISDRRACTWRRLVRLPAEQRCHSGTYHLEATWPHPAQTRESPVVRSDLEVLERADIQAIVNAPSEILADARNGHERISRVCIAAQAVELRPVARRQHFANRGSDAVADSGQFLESLAPLTREERGQRFRQRLDRGRRSGIGIGPKRIGLLLP